MDKLQLAPDPLFYYEISTVQIENGKSSVLIHGPYQSQREALITINMWMMLRSYTEILHEKKDKLGFLHFTKSSTISAKRRTPIPPENITIQYHEINNNDDRNNQ